MERRRPSAGDVEQADFLSLRFIEGVNGLRRRLNNNLAVLVREESMSFGSDPCADGRISKDLTVYSRRSTDKVHGFHGG
jgi:hypothetical protein